MDFNPGVLLQALHLDSLNSSLDPLSIFRRDVLKRTILKKYVAAGQTGSLHSAAVASFKARNASLSQEFSVPDQYKDLFQSWQYKIYDLVMSGPFQSSVLTLDRCVHYGLAGPGASRGTKHTNFLDKMFNSTLTTTDLGLYTFYRSRLSERWLIADSIRNEAYSVKVVSGNALSSVPKDAGKNRCICTEPSLNMFFQLGAKHIINNLLVNKYFLNVSDQQDINRKLARLGSIDGSNATLDLRDASDSIHHDLVKKLFPHEFFNVLDRIRSKTFEVNSEVTELNMISSMGNGFTFSLMTLMLTSLLDVFLRTKGDSYRPLRDGVFGDDIIMPSQYAEEFSSVLSGFGFSVNLDKSFITGNFRESCGGDFLHGHNVRGVYIKEISNEAQLYSAFNRIHFWCIRHNIWLPNTLLYLKGLANFRPIPLYEAEHCGFRIPAEFTKARKFDRNGATKYSCIDAVTHSRRVTDDEHNYHAALFSAIGGYVRQNRVTYRARASDLGKLRFKVIKRVTPNWDYLSDPEVKLQDLSTSWDYLLS